MNKTVSLETWREVPDYEGLYQVSTFGRVRSVKRPGNPKERILKPWFNAGYPTVDLWKEGEGKQKRVHVLVAEAFIPNPNHYPFVNHLDGSRDNSRVDNLEWCTAAMNNKHAFSIGLRSNKGEKNSRYGQKQSAETKAKIAAKMTGNKNAKDWVKRKYGK